MNILDFVFGRMTLSEQSLRVLSDNLERELIRERQITKGLRERVAELEALATERKEIADNLADQKVELEQRLLEARIRDITGALDMKEALASPDPAKWIQACDNAQATRAQFRILKQKVTSLQTYVDATLAGLDKLGRANVVTKEDIRKLREYRDELKRCRESGVITIKAEEPADG